MISRYDAARDVLEVVPNNNDPTFACNSARVATYLRPASENAHTFKQIYKHFGTTCHHSRLTAVGEAVLNHYNQKYGRNFPVEWAESSKLYIEYLVCTGRYNENHSLFFRYAVK